MWRRSRAPRVETEHLFLRPPRHSDYRAWAAERRASRRFLTPWEPTWAEDHLTRAAFRHRVSWAERSIRQERAYPFFIFRSADGALLGAVTIDNIRRGPAETGTVGYWIGEAHGGKGVMTEALGAIADFAFGRLGLGRLEAGCLPENTSSRKVLERCGFKYEGVGQAYLRINGRWRDHVLYARIGPARRAG